jgi:hypothetical protein
MKETIFTLMFAAILLIACSGRTSNNNNRSADDSADTSKVAVIAFDTYEFDFGKIKAGRKLRHTFFFENQGTGALVIQSANTTCGCTVPRYDSRPIAPGKTGRLEVEFDSRGYDGMQTKTVTVHSNATVPVVILKITAEVTR